MTYMLADRVTGYEVKVYEATRGRKIIERKTFTDYDAAMKFMDLMEEKYWKGYIVEFNTKFR